VTKDADDTQSSVEWPIPRLDDLTAAKMRGEIPFSDADRAEAETLFGSEMQERIITKRKQRLDECAILFLQFYGEVAKKLDGDALATWSFVDGLLRVWKPPQKRRGKKDPDRDARLLAAYDAAPKGQKENAVASADGARNERQIDAAVKHARRLVAAREVYRKDIEAMSDTFLEAYRKGGPSAAAEAVIALHRKTDK
jgi:hypothetical protein